MKTLSNEINIAFSHLMDGFKDGGRYVNSNILPKITSNQILRSRGLARRI